MFKSSIIKAVVVMMIVTSMSSCVTTRLTNVPNSSTISSLDKDRIEILGPAIGNAGGGRVWILFIPIGWGRDSWCESTAYKNALKSYPNADGIIEQTQSYHRVRVPLLVITPVVKKVEVRGTAYHIRTDAELEEYLKTKAQKSQ